ncbi:MAG: hypothetical protein ACOYOK_06080 [Pseudobdellovibrionaceae bacterium]
MTPTTSQDLEFLRIGSLILAGSLTVYLLFKNKSKKSIFENILLISSLNKINLQNLSLCFVEGLLDGLESKGAHQPPSHTSNKKLKL